jgi:hypothetical protein
MAAQDQRDYPVATTTGAIGGASTTGLISGGSGFVRLAAQGAGQGAISGLTAGGENPLEDAALGGTLGAVGGLGAAGLNKGAELARKALGKNPVVQDAMRRSMAIKEEKTVAKLAEKTGLSPDDVRRAVDLKLPLGLTGKDAKLVQSLRGQQQARQVVESRIANDEWLPTSRPSGPGLVDAGTQLAGQAARVALPAAGGYIGGYGTGMVTGQDPHQAGMGGAMLLGGLELARGKAGLLTQAAQSAATVLPKAGVRNLGNAARGAAAAAVPIRDAAQPAEPASNELDQFRVKDEPSDLEQFRVKDEKPSSDELEQFRVR